MKEMLKEIVKQLRPKKDFEHPSREKEKKKRKKVKKKRKKKKKKVLAQRILESSFRMCGFLGGKVPILDVILGN